MTTDAAWLAMGAEAALEPDLPIVDPHHHLWDRAGHRYLVDELLADIGSGHNIVATVHIECGSMYRADGPVALRSVGETEFANGIAAMSASGGYGSTRVCAGIVGHADLSLGPAAGEVLDAHMAAAPARFRGIRHAAGWDESPAIRNSHSNPPRGLLGDAGFRAGFAGLAPRGLLFEAWLYHPQIGELTDLARAFPETTIVFDHFGGPLGIGPYAGRGADIFSAWKRDVAALAACPNVVAKLGGLAMKINGGRWHKQVRPPSSEELATAHRDWYLTAIDIFGPERCMFESNFPVDKVSIGYGALWNAFKRLAAPFSASEKAALFHDTARSIYRLP